MLQIKAVFWRILSCSEDARLLFCSYLQLIRCSLSTQWGASLVAQMVKNLLAMQKIQIWSQGEDPLEEGMATHSSILAWRVPWMELPSGLQSMGSWKSWTWLSNWKIFDYLYFLLLFWCELMRCYRNHTQNTAQMSPGKFNGQNYSHPNLT